MKINLISDFHRRTKEYKIPEEADICINCGDCSNPEIITGNQPIFTVKGNHDWWDNEVEYDVEEYKFADTVLITTTLWSDFKPNIGEESMFNDFNFISNWRLQKHNEMYQKCLGGIDKIVKRHKDKKIIIATHFCPTKSCLDERYKNCSASVNSYYMNDLEKYILDNTNIQHWFHGHTHCSKDFMIGNCRVVCNAYGNYPGENPNFNENLIIEV